MRILISILSLSIVLLSSNSHAQIEACGVPEDPTIKTEATEYCDMHQRRFAYRESRKEFKEILDERRENYQAPQREIKAQYERDLKSLHGQIGND